MGNTFELKKGKLVFESGKIVISDNAKYKRRYSIFQSLLALLLAASFVHKYLKTGLHSDLTFGILMAIFGLLKLGFEFFRTVQSEIAYSEVKSMKVKRIWIYEFLIIKLRNNKSRLVYGILNAERLEDYISAGQFV